jgi:hypothetical protein
MIMVVKVKEESATLFDYLQKNIETNVVNHVIQSVPLPNGIIQITLYPANGEGETPKFFVKDNKITKTIEELVS